MRVWISYAMLTASCLNFLSCGSAQKAAAKPEKIIAQAKDEQQRGQIGISVIQDDLDPIVYVQKVYLGSPADAAGLKYGDVIKRIGDVGDITTYRQAADAFRRYRQEAFAMVVERDGEEIEVRIEFTRDAEAPAGE